MQLKMHIYNLILYKSFGKIHFPRKSISKKYLRGKKEVSHMLQPLRQDIMDLLVDIQLKDHPKEGQSLFTSIMYISMLTLWDRIDL